MNIDINQKFCLHCAHPFGDLAGERRRKVKNINEFDFVEIFTLAYSNANHDEIEQSITSNDGAYICAKCFGSFKSVSTNLQKYSNSINHLKSLSCNNSFTTYQTSNDTPVLDINNNNDIDIKTSDAPSNSKRTRECITPIKSGFTPNSKTKRREECSPQNDRKSNRRRLCFSEQKNTKLLSPGPKVKVQIGYKSSRRNTELRGHSKLACRALVMKQYKAAINHMFQIDDIRKDINSITKKKVNQEIVELIKNKKCVLRSSNLHKFSWKNAYRQFESTCPLTLDLFKTICGKRLNLPRLVSSLAVLLFTRNQQLNVLQSINSILMFRGHVRTKVYTSFNRAGLSSSYKSTLTTVDKICNNFDEPVKRWAKHLSTTIVPRSQTCFDDHAYAANHTEFTSNLPDTSEDTAVHINDLTVNDDTPIGKDDTSVENDDTRIYDLKHSQSLNIDTENLNTPLSRSLQPTLCDEDSPFTTRSSTACNEYGTFQIIMDNLNMNQKTRHKTLETSNKVHNLVHSVAVLDRVIPENTMDEIHPQADILSIPNTAFIPDENDVQHLQEDFCIMIQRALVENVPALSQYRGLVEFHIPHEFSENAEKKSTVIPLGILEKDENITEQMIDVIEHLQQYVPERNDKLKPILLGGDALSVERGEAAQQARADAISPKERLDGFVWKSEDWHGHVISLQDTFSHHFKGTSSSERGTLFQLRNMFDRRGVKSEVKDAVNDCREFLRFVTRGYIILAAMQLLHYTKIEDFKDVCNSHSSDNERKEFLSKLSKDIVENFATLSVFHFGPVNSCNNRDTRYACGYPGCPKTFKLDGRCRLRHRNTCQYKNFDGVLQVPVNDRDRDRSANNDRNKNITNDEDSLKTDYKLNYSCSLLTDGLLDWCREDASKENDGERIVRMWKYDMLRFSVNHHIKYRLLAFKLQAQLLALLPETLSYKLKHNRSVNIHGGKGCNIPGDLSLEILNMRAKDSLNSLRGNMTSSSIQRCGRSLQGCNDIIDSYTAGLNQFFGKPIKSKPSIQKDIDMLVKQLQPEQLFHNIPKRFHKSFERIDRDMLSKLDGQKLSSWLTQKKEDYSKLQRLKSYVV